MSRIPLLPVTVPFVLGILVCYCVGQTGWLFLLFAVLAVLLFLMRRKLVAVALLGAVAGYVVAMLHTPVPIPAGTGDDMLYSGVVAEQSERGSMRIMVVDVDSVSGLPVSMFRVKVLVPTLGIRIDECDRVRFVAGMKPLSRDTDLPDEIDYNAQLAVKGVVGECYVVPDSVKSIVAEPGLMNDIRRCRLDVCALLAGGTLSPEASDFLIAVMAGEREVLTPSHRGLFSDAGLAHLLALSGLHVGIIAGVVSVLLFPVVLWRRWPACVITIATLWGFAVMTGLSPSVTRSVIMCTVFLVSVMVQREWSPVNALCLAALVILLFAPYALFSLGFQLSFVAVLSIIIFADVLNPFKDSGSNARWLAMLLTVPIAAMLGTGIVSVCHFHSFPVFFLVGNMLASLFLPPLLTGGVVKVVAGVFGLTPVWLDRVVDFLYGVLHSIAGIVTSLPGAVIDSIYVPPLVVIAYLVSLALLAAWLYSRRICFLFASLMLVAFMLVVPTVTTDRYVGGGELYVTRSHSETTLLVRDGGKLLTFTTAHPSQIPMVVERDSARYSVYMMRRGIGRLTLLHDGYRSNRVARVANTVCFRDKRLQLVSSDRYYKVDSLDYALVCRGFRGDVVELARLLAPDSVVLSGDLVLRRHDRYARELAEAGIPFRSLRDAPFVIK